MAPLDVARSAVLRALLGVRALRHLLVRRDRRVALWATLHALVALLITASFPMLLFVLGPVLLGVAHVAADVRYLVIRRRLPAGFKSAVWIGCAALITLRAAEEIGGRGGLLSMRLEYGAALGFVLLALGAGARVSGRARRAVLALPLVVAAGVAALLYPAAARLVFVHLHNVMAIVLWLALFRLRPRAALVPLAVIAAATLWLLGAPLSWSQATGGIFLFDIHLFAASDWLAPGLAPELSVGLTLAFVFLQSVHYSAWLLLVPQEDAPSQGTLTFRMSVRALFADFGRAGVVALAIGALAVVAGALLDVHRARGLYLSLAMFHGYLELALLAWFWARGSRPASEPARASTALPQPLAAEGAADSPAAAIRSASSLGPGLGVVRSLSP